MTELENFSETPKRGRPRAFAPYTEALADILTGGLPATPRHRQNLLYRQRAAVRLLDDNRFTWLIDREGKRVKSTILAELGRIEDEQQMREVAESLCSLRPSTSDAVALIRGFRGVQQKGSAGALAGLIRQQVMRYWNAHPEMSLAEVTAGLDLAMEQVEATK